MKLNVDNILEAVDRELLVRGLAVVLAEEPGHEFHGNQWTHESLAAKTDPLRERHAIGDEVVFRKDDGTVGRGQLGFKVGLTKRESGESKAGFRRRLVSEGEHEVLELGTGAKLKVPNAHLRMPKGGFRNKDFTAKDDFFNASEPDGLGSSSREEARGKNHRHAADVVLQTARLQSVANWMMADARESTSALELHLEQAVRKDDPSLGAASQARCFAAADRAVLKTFDTLRDDLEGKLQGLAEAAAGKARERLAEHHGRKGSSQVPAAHAVTVMGATVADHCDKLASDCLFRFKAAVRAGVKAGEGAEAIVARLQGRRNPVLGATGPGAQNAPQTKPGAKNNVLGGGLVFAEGAGHEFHGNQWAKEPGEKANVEMVEVGALKTNPNEPWSERYTLEQSKNDSHAGRLAVRMKAGKKFTALTVITNPDGSKTVIDGQHRLAAAKMAGLTHVGVQDVSYRLKASEPVRSASLDIAQALMDAAEGGLNKLIEAAVASVAHEAEQGASEGDGDEDEDQPALGWQWVAVMDPATCERCQFYDGSRWDAEFEPVGESPEFPDEPPLHFNCRCALVPSDLAEEGAPPRDFDDYLAGFSRSEQEQAFGKENLRSYHRGDITANQLVGQRDNLMTLEQFKEAE